MTTSLPSWTAWVSLAYGRGRSLNSLPGILQGEGHGRPRGEHRPQLRQRDPEGPARPQPVQQHRLQREVLLDRLQSDEARVPQRSRQGTVQYSTDENNIILQLYVQMYNT